MEKCTNLIFQGFATLPDAGVPEREVESFRKSVCEVKKFASRKFCGPDFNFIENVECTDEVVIDGTYQSILTGTLSVIVHLEKDEDIGAVVEIFLKEAKRANLLNVRGKAYRNYWA